MLQPREAIEIYKTMPKWDGNAPPIAISGFGLNDLVDEAIRSWSEIPTNEDNPKYLTLLHLGSGRTLMFGVERSGERSIRHAYLVGSSWRQNIHYSASLFDADLLADQGPRS